MSLAEQRYTYADYNTWEDYDESGNQIRYELIDGVPYALASPSRRHQEILGELFGQFRDFLKGKPYKVFVAPLDVRLNAQNTNDILDDNVLQPDLFIVCDRRKLDNNSIIGAPDMIVEILSPRTMRHDKFIKYQKYQHAGVREYWIIDPENRSLQVCLLENGKYTSTTYNDNDTVPVHILEGCKINLSDVFAQSDF